MGGRECFHVRIENWSRGQVQEYTVQNLKLRPQYRCSNILLERRLPGKWIAVFSESEAALKAACTISRIDP